MPRVRISTTVDEHLLSEVRSLVGGNDASVVAAAFEALLAAHRAAAHDAAYAAYDTLPMDEPDEWGDLASWTDAAGAS